MSDRWNYEVHGLDRVEKFSLRWDGHDKSYQVQSFLVFDYSGLLDAATLAEAVFSRFHEPGYDLPRGELFGDDILDGTVVIRLDPNAKSISFVHPEYSETWQHVADEVIPGD